jgi:hypothetical protein
VSSTLKESDLADQYRESSREMISGTVGLFNTFTVWAQTGKLRLGLHNVNSQIFTIPQPSSTSLGKNLAVK